MMGTQEVTVKNYILARKVMLRCRFERGIIECSRCSDWIGCTLQNHYFKQWIKLRELIK